MLDIFAKIRYIIYRTIVRLSKCDFSVAKGNYRWREHPPFLTHVGVTRKGRHSNLHDTLFFPTLVGVILKG